MKSFIPHGMARRAVNGVTTHASPWRWSALLVVAFVAGCANAGGGPDYHYEIMRAQQSPIPGAQARVFVSPQSPGTVASSGFCVTTAGYCPLAAAAPAGENCLCSAGGNQYGGTTGDAPQLTARPENGQ